MTVMRSIKNSLHPSLRSMPAAAYRATPSDALIAPVGDDRYSTIFNVIPLAVSVLRVAAEIDPDPDAVIYWYSSTRIRELGNLTAMELVELGSAQIVIDFLRAARDGHRD